MKIRIGLPYMPGPPGHPFTVALDELRAASLTSVGSLISVGSLFRPETGWRRPALSVWRHGPALDSAGFVAQARFGGYRWSVEDYVDRVVRNFTRDDGGDEDPPRWAMPHPWAWWSAMDFCCEAEIAPRRDEVVRRMAATVDSYVETLGHLQGWRDEGDTDTPDPLPILQGRRPEDYLAMARELAAAIDGAHRCTCPLGDPESCPSGWHREHAGLPALVGLGSVCRRPVGGAEGILSVIAALDAHLPPHVQLHLFGVKGSVLGKLVPVRHRVASIDSAAWDLAARRAAKSQAVKRTPELRAAFRRRWYLAQRPEPVRQVSLFAPRGVSP